MEPISIALALAQATGLDKRLGRWLGGDKGAEIAGKVVGIAQDITGGKQPAEVLAAIQADKEMAAKLTLQLQQLAAEQDIRELQDISNARAMQQAALAQEDVFSKRFVYLFAIGWSVTAAIYIFCITFFTIPHENIRFADSLCGFLMGTIISTIITFFYGSSRSSQKKDVAIEQLTKGQ